MEKMMSLREIAEVVEGDTIHTNDDDNIYTDEGVEAAHTDNVADAVAEDAVHTDNNADTTSMETVHTDNKTNTNFTEFEDASQDAAECTENGSIVTAQDVINALYEPDERVSIRILSDRKKDGFKGRIVMVDAAKFPQKEDYLKSQNAKNRGIFFMVNKGEDNDGSVKRINSQFVEMDDGTFDEQWEKIKAFPLQPSMVIQTKKSLHTYWFLRNSADPEAEVGRFRPIQLSLIKWFDGDPACQNESRVMRLPGFNHCKGDAVEVKCVLFHPERRYTQDEIAACFPDDQTAPEESPDERYEGHDKGLASVTSRCAFIDYCKENAGTLPEPLWYAMITELVGFEGGVGEIHRLSSPHPDYDEAETDRKVSHFINSGTGPITCHKIEGLGFKCPKAGSCRCKSPASLCHEPLSNGELLGIIDTLPVASEVFDCLVTAKEFVTDCLFNTDPVMATSVINYPLKEHMRLKAGDMRPLITYQKQLYREYKKEKERTAARQRRQDIPPWYVPTEWGTLKFLPDVLAEYMADNKPVFYAAEEFYRYEDGVYSIMDDLEAKDMVRREMLKGETHLSQITDSKAQWQMQVRRDIRSLNPNPYMINIRNGLYSVLDGRILPHSEGYPSTVQLNVEYRPDSQCPRFISYLRETLSEDQIPLVQEMLGYFLVPITRAQKCFVIVGEGGAGKSVLLHVIDKILLGEGSVSHVSWQALNERFKTAELFGKLANVFADLPTKNIDDTGVFKALVGEDYLTVEKKNKNPFAFQSTARLLFSCNKIPRNYSDRSEGFYRRLIIIRFPSAVAKDKIDVELLDKLESEADGIFRFALAGLKRLMGNRFRFSVTKSNDDELQKYREESNSVLAFVRDWCEVDEEYEVGRTELYDAYKAYCNDSSMNPFGRKTFHAEFETQFPKIAKAKDRTGKRRTWRGIRLMDEADRD